MGTANMKLHVDAAAADAQGRTVLYEIGNNFLVVHNILTDLLGLRPVAVLVWLTVAIATVQRFMREASPEPGLLTRAPLPIEHAGAISRRGIARATGLPAETVRRSVAALLAAGLLESAGRNNVRTPPGVAQNMPNDRVVEALNAIALMTERLNRAGVLRTAPAG